MKIFSRLTALALLATTAAPALAGPPAVPPQVRQRNHFEQVKDLAIKAGLNLQLNQTHCKHNGKFDPKVVGTYNSKLRTVCIVNHTIIGAKLWYSTFYHELFHFVQDSLDGRIGDNNLLSFFTACEGVRTSRQCKDLYLDIYTAASASARSHAATYSAKQKDKHLMWLEREAVLFSDQPEMYPLLLKMLIKKQS